MLHNFERFEQAFKYAIKLADTNKDQAKTFFRTYAKVISDESYMKPEEANALLKKNFKLFSKYFGEKTEKLVCDVFDACHEQISV